MNNLSNTVPLDGEEQLTKGIKYTLDGESYMKNEIHFENGDKYPSEDELKILIADFERVFDTYELKYEIMNY
jgi:hypothetical protein